MSREDVLRAGRMLVAKHGTEALSLRMVAEELGLTTPALYRHVDSKSELLAAVAAIEWNYLLHDVESIEEDDPIEWTRRSCEVAIQRAVDNPALFELQMAFPPSFMSSGDFEQPAADRAMKLAMERWDEAVAKGQVAGGEVRIKELAVWSATRGVAAMLRSDRIPRAWHQPLIRAVVDGIIDGVIALETPAERR